MKRLSRFVPTLIYFTSLFLLLIAMGFVGLYLSVGPGLPEVESIRKIRLQTPMRVYSRDEQLIAEFGDTRRIPITLDQVPRDFINALLSTEDQRFYEHSGVDLLGVLRAFINLAATGTKSQGASTITMLVARNYYLTREKRFSRKFTEMFLAWKIESELSKNEILELFLNKIHFSHRAYGLGAAAQVYYGKNLQSLSLPQLATLAGIPKGESMYNPISNPENALKRRTHVLGRMLAEGHISQQQYQQANSAPIETQKHGMQIAVNAPYLAEMVRQNAIEQFGIDAAYNDGIKIYTTLDANLQRYAQEALKLGLEGYDKRHGYRGPEHQYAISEETSTEQLEEWIGDIPVVAKLTPALVTQLADEKATIMVKDVGYAEILLKDLKWAKKYVDENHVERKKIKASSDVLSRGDLIRVASLDQVNEESGLPLYKLSQIPEVSGGFVALNPRNGAIEALVGDYDYTLSKYNMVTQARRQPGSNIKPFIYAAAFEKGYTPASLLNDMPIVEADITAENIWRPKNDGDVYLGPTSLRVALRRSRNTVSVRLMREIEPGYAKSYLTNVGFPADHMKPYLSLALGSSNFTPLEVATTYATLANGGYKVSNWFVERVEDANGRIIQQHVPVEVCEECETFALQSATLLNKTAEVDSLEEQTLIETENSSELPEISEQNDFINLPRLPLAEEFVAPRVIDKRNHYLINDILKDVIHRGTAFPTLSRTKSTLLKRFDLAGKTGTTNDAKDAWFSGYNRQHVATAWVGFKDHSRKLGVREFGGRAALPIWQKFMEQTVTGTAQTQFERPEGIVTVRIDPKTGLLATNLTENPIFEMFKSEDAPTDYADKPIDDPFDLSDEEVEEDSLF